MKGGLKQFGAIDRAMNVIYVVSSDVVRGGASEIVLALRQSRSSTYII